MKALTHQMIAATANALSLSMAMASIAILLAVPLRAHAYATLNLDHPTNLDADHALAIAEKINLQRPETTAVRAYRVLGLEPKARETQMQAALRVLKSVLRRDFATTGDDGGYALSVVDSTPSEVANSLGDTPFADAHELTVTVQRLAQSGIFVVSGTGSGRHSMATITALIDLHPAPPGTHPPADRPKQTEIIYMIDSNFGHDE